MHRKIAFPILLALLLVAGSALFGSSTHAAQHHAKKRATTHKKSVHAKRTRAVVRTQHRTTRRRYHRRRPRYRGQRAPTSGRISEIQQALAKNGAFTGSPDGKWGPSTVEAMKKFQSSNGLNATGKLDARTLQKLGLGSQIAGIAPPLPPSGSAALGDEPTEAARQ
jgi:murein L,D-transpeptidase YcbB/YkuD